MSLLCPHCGKDHLIYLEFRGFKSLSCHLCGYVSYPQFPARAGADQQIIDDREKARIQAELRAMGLLENPDKTHLCARCGVVRINVRRRHCAPCKRIIDDGHHKTWQKANAAAYKATQKKYREKLKAQRAGTEASYSPEPAAAVRV